MKTALWTLLLMGLFVPGRSSCQSDCNYCDRILNGIQGFDITVCAVECHKESLDPTWGMCQKVKGIVPIISMSIKNSMLKSPDEDTDYQSQGRQEDKKKPERNDKLKNNKQGDQTLTKKKLTKRLGGFLKKYSYKKMTKLGKSFNKRLGGFLGIRKSARKWKSGKRKVKS